MYFICVSYYYNRLDGMQSNGNIVSFINVSLYFKKSVFLFGKALVLLSISFYMVSRKFVPDNFVPAALFPHILCSHTMFTLTILFPVDVTVTCDYSWGSVLFRNKTVRGTKLFGNITWEKKVAGTKCQGTFSNILGSQILR